MRVDVGLYACIHVHYVCMYMCPLACMHTFTCARVRACMRLCVRACVRVCVCALCTMFNPVVKSVSLVLYMVHCNRSSISPTLHASHSSPYWTLHVYNDRRTRYNSNVLTEALTPLMAALLSPSVAGAPLSP